MRTHKALAFGAGVAAGPFVEASSLGLRGDPTADQTDALRSALETAARRKAVLRLPKGIVRVTDLDMSGPVRIAGRPGASLQATDRATYVISVTDGPVWMHGVHMDGRFAGHRDGPALLEVRNASEVLLDSCTIRRGKGNLVNLEKCRGEVRNCLLEKAFT
ncbi:MAG TPA: hypothetical protein ENK13_04855, partial [Thermopetrobacter sp.]|nr:hypothetical protein [Thermopetrobacter sp.]